MHRGRSSKLFTGCPSRIVTGPSFTNFHLHQATKAAARNFTDELAYLLDEIFI